MRAVRSRHHSAHRRCPDMRRVRRGRGKENIPISTSCENTDRTELASDSIGGPDAISRNRDSVPSTVGPVDSDQQTPTPENNGTVLVILWECRGSQLSPPSRARLRQIPSTRLSSATTVRPPTVYPPITNSCRSLTRILVQAPEHSPALYLLSRRFATRPSKPWARMANK